MPTLPRRLRPTFLRYFNAAGAVDPMVEDHEPETHIIPNVLKVACGVVSRYWKVRDAAEGERVVQTALCSLLYVGHGPYIVSHEQELAGGFVDIAFEPQLNRWPQIGHAALVELKYLKQQDDASPAALAKIRDDAAQQIVRYAADHDLARKWNLREQGGTVVLHRLVVVFHGGDIALCEEIPNEKID